MISGISLDGNKFFYPNPLEADGVFTFNKGSCTRQSWFDCSCCPTNIIRFVPGIPGLIYASNKDSLYINLFMANKATITLDNTNVQILQETDYPRGGHIAISISPDKQKYFTLKVRIPGWAKGQVVPGTLYEYLEENPDTIVVRINGNDEELHYKKGYIEISRNWTPGDQVEVILPMKIQRVVTNEKVHENKNLVALEYGPLVYCAEEIDDNNLSEIYIPDSIAFRIEKREDLLDGVNIITGSVPDDTSKDALNMVFIPYYSWSNRGVGQMKVWLPRHK
ncbi:Non-reducing end beta-L-arabinofuranosidase [subsurface metagenome]